MEAFATKYRPQSFDDLVGQDNIKIILQNQIRSGDIRQAYLFCGGAGTGKTTTARIFAREINGGDGTVIEIDAASNNGVDHVRNLREDCQFKPMGSRYKVYIIDEVHMLSTGAFNALLKTLEEPPAHAVFILCTTDPQKIPPTILSRVQRFDFRRMTVPQIVSRLRYILQSENGQSDEPYEVADEALEYIAKAANGGMRDAISLLDTCLGYGRNLSLDDVVRILGGTPYETYLQVLECLNEGKRGEIAVLVEELHLAGKDLRQFVRGLAEFVVELMKMEMMLDSEYISVPAVHHERMGELLRSYAQKGRDLGKLFTLLNDVYYRVRYEQHPKVLIMGELMAIC